MSYSRPGVRRRRLSGLGDVPVPGRTLSPGFRGVPNIVGSSLPSWEAASDGTTEQSKQNGTYRKITDDAVLNQIQARLVQLYAMNPADVFDVDTGQPSARRPYQTWHGLSSGKFYEIREDAPFLQALKSFWVREGKNDDYWPGSGGQTDFGPNTDQSTNLQISKALYELLSNPGTPPWKVHTDGYVRMRSADYLYNTMVRDSLRTLGYLSAGNVEINTKDDGPMVKALEAFHREGLASGLPGLDYGVWPSDSGFGYNFGPNTNGDEVRITPQLLTSVLSGWSPRVYGTLAQRTAAQQAFATATIRPPIFGMPTDAKRPTLSNPAALKLVLANPSLLSSLRLAITPVITKVSS